MRITIARKDVDGHLRYVDIIETNSWDICDDWFSGWMSQYPDCVVFVTPDGDYQQSPVFG